MTEVVFYLLLVKLSLFHVLIKNYFVTDLKYKQKLIFWANLKIEISVTCDLHHIFFLFVMFWIFFFQQ